MQQIELLEATAAEACDAEADAYDGNDDEDKEYDRLTWEERCEVAFFYFLFPEELQQLIAGNNISMTREGKMRMN